MDLAGRLGWLRYHVRPAQTAKGWRTPIQGDAGFPDLVLARRGRIIFAELKADGEGPTDQQIVWMGHLETGLPGEQVKVRLWRPQDWQEVVRTLTAMP